MLPSALVNRRKVISHTENEVDDPDNPARDRDTPYLTFILSMYICVTNADPTVPPIPSSD